MTTIPASQLVDVIPGALGVGGSAIDILGLVLTTNTRIPIGTVQSFLTAAAVGSFFGSATKEASISSVYFGGYTGSTVQPGSILYAQYPLTAVAAYLRGGNISSMTLTALQALSGSLTVLIDGYTHTAGSINLSTASSFSSAAALIQTALTASEPTEATVTASIGATFTGTGSGANLTATAVTGLISVGDTITGTGVPANTTIVSQTSGTTGGAGVYVTSNSTTSSAASLTGASAVLDVTVVASGALAVGQVLTGSGVTANTAITGLLTGTGGTGTYRISITQSVASETVTGVATAPTVTYDSVSGAFVITSGITGTPSLAAYATGTLAAPLLLTSATGAVLSQGAAATTPATFMNSLIQVTQDWATFFTAFDPDGGSGNAQKLAFAAWTNSQANQFAYLAWDTDASPTLSTSAPSSLGAQVTSLGYSGTSPIYEASDLYHAAFLSGAAASIDFTQKDGRITFAYKTQAGLAASVSSVPVATNLIANGYNFIGAYATASQSFVNFQKGTISGPFKWLDSYINQIWLNASLQLALMQYLTSVRSVPYITAGYAAIETALAPPIQAGLNFGAYRAGVTLSAAQIVAVNAAAGVNIAGTLSTQGWYLQILDASPEVRDERGSPPMTFWYVDGGSIQKIVLNSIVVQ